MLDQLLDVEFDIDLGELVEGHRVVARGIRFGCEEAGAGLFYDFVPGIIDRPDGRMYWYWTHTTEDDQGTEYNDNNSGAFAPGDGLAMSPGSRDLGARVPDSATRLLIRFSPADGWEPPGPYVELLTIDLVSRTVSEIKSTAR